MTETAADLRFAPNDLGFIADPYPVCAHLRAHAPVLYDEATDHYLISRYEDVNALLRDRRFGRTYLPQVRDEGERLREDRSLLPTAIEELLRFDTPAPMFERWVLEDVELHGVEIPPGAELGLLFASANRDPDVFDRPDELDLARDPNPHLTFGAGIHFCLGAPLGRQEMLVSFGTVLERLPNLELVAEPVWKPGYVIRGLAELRVRA